MTQIIRLISLIISLFGIEFIFSARELTKRYFSRKKENTVVNVFKIIGFILVSFALVMLSFVKL